MDAKLLEIIACPVCKGEFVYRKDKQELICRFDRLAFPVKDGLPILLKEKARLMPADEEVSDKANSY